MKPSARSLRHETFRVSITLKGIDGLLQIIGGVLVWFITPSSMNRMVLTLFQHGVARDPHDYIATHLLIASQKFASGGKMFASLFLLSHGLVKVVLVVALWLNRLWAYPLLIVVFGAFSIYQVYRFTHTHSLGLALLTIVDVFIIYLTWREYREQKMIQSKTGESQTR
jgi:uncharacterized membrane protein